MKTRFGYVSNSSSSSFIVVLDKGSIPRVMEECRKIGISPTTTQLQHHFGWTQTVASKVKSFIEIIDSKEKLEDAE